MSLPLPLLSAAAGVLLAAVVAAGAHAWYQHTQTAKARAQLSEARTGLVLCETDKATLGEALREQTAAVASWEAWGARVREANARAMAEADQRRRALEVSLEAAQRAPAGNCEAEAEELGRWFESVRS